MVLVGRWLCSWDRLLLLSPKLGLGLLVKILLLEMLGGDHHDNWLLLLLLPGTGGYELDARENSAWFTRLGIFNEKSPQFYLKWSFWLACRCR